MYQNSGLSYKGSRVQIPPARQENNGSKPLRLGTFLVSRVGHISGALLVQGLPPSSFRPHCVSGYTPKQRLWNCTESSVLYGIAGCMLV